MLQKTASGLANEAALRQIMGVLHTKAITDPAPLPKINAEQEKSREMQRQECIAAAGQLRAAGYLVTRKSLAKCLEWEYTKLHSFLYSQPGLAKLLGIVRHPDNAPTYVNAPE